METDLVALSPSRAADFKACPLLFKFRTIDRLPEPPDPSRARGTIVHAVLERLCRGWPRVFLVGLLIYVDCPLAEAHGA